jgi:nucleoside-diphosphate-sugar epimerase
MSILITGALGKIGWELSQQIEGAWLLDKRTVNDEQYLSVDLRDPESLKSSLRRIGKIETVYHCAAFVNNYGSIREPWKSWETNVVGTQNLINALGPDVHYVLPSCLEVKTPVTPYHLSKINQEALIGEMNSHHICRAGVVFGIEGMVSEMIRSALANKPILIPGKHRIVDLIHITDFTARLQDQDNKRSIPIDLNSLASMILELCQSRSEFIFSDQEMWDPSHQPRAFHGWDLDHFEEQMKKTVCQIIETDAGQ